MDTMLKFDTNVDVSVNGPLDFVILSIGISERSKGPFT